jgi:hypothetical protein
VSRITRKSRQYRILRTLQKVLSERPDLLLPKWREECKGDPCPLAGHCALGAEAIYWLLEHGKAGWKLYYMRWENAPHWFVRNVKTGEVVDPTCIQYSTTPDYNLGRGGWINRGGRGPSARAREVILEVRKRLRHE